MKKSTMIAAVFAASAFSAFAVDVYSSNIVGYTKVDVSAAYTLLGSQFVNVGGSTKDINELGDATSLLSFDQSDTVYDFQTLLLKWNGNGYDTYGWFGATDGTDVMGDDNLNNKWVDYNTWSAEAVPLEVGIGMWIQSAGASTITFMGEVESASSVTNQLAIGYNLVANPYPSVLDIQDVGSTAGFAPFDQSDTVYDFQTLLLKWNGNGYDTYGWFGATDGTDVMGDANLNNKWVDYNTWTTVDVEFSIGEGFWINTPQASDVTIIK